MSDHQSETAFLRYCLSYDESHQRQELDERINQIQRDERCVRRAVWLMAILVALSATGLGYGAALGDNFPYNTPPFAVKTISALGLGSLISLLVFVMLGIAYRRKLDQRREECRQIVQRLLETRLVKPLAAAPSGVSAEPGSIAPQAGPDRLASGTNLARAP